MLHKFPALIGLSGVAPEENQRARFWASCMDLPLLLIGIWLLMTWYLDVKGQIHGMHKIQDWFIWIFFTSETVLLTMLVTHKKNYLRTNWMNIVIIVAGIPVLWHDAPYAIALRTLRILLALSIFVHLTIPLRSILSKNHFGATLLVSSILITCAGILGAGIDPGIGTPENGIWWAWVTATTVGYGDVVPTTLEGRLLAGVLIIVGFCLFSLITANVSAYFISRGEEEEIDTRLDRIEILLKRIEADLDRLNKQSTLDD